MKCDDVDGNDLYRAQHECGHGLIACGFGGRLVKVDIAERGGKRGVASYSLGSVGRPYYRTAGDKWFREMFISLAGEAATLLLPGYLGDDYDWSSDKATAERCAQKLLFYCRAFEDAPDESEVSEYLQSQLKRVRSVLEKEHVKATLDVVAKELVEKREMSGEEFHDMARSALDHLERWLPGFGFELPQ